METTSEQDQVNDNRLFSKRVPAGKRTYFFDVKETRNNDIFITVSESRRRYDGKGFSKSVIHLYKEDFLKFADGLIDTIDYVRQELLPDFDYENPVYPTKNGFGNEEWSNEEYSGNNYDVEKLEEAKEMSEENVVEAD